MKKKMSDYQINIEEEALRHRKNAEVVIDIFKAQNDIELKYDIQSLEFLENYITSIKGHIDSPQMEQILAMIGCFLGETFIQNFVGTWDVWENNWMIRFDEKNGVFPINKVFKFYENGQEDSFASMFSTWKVINNNKTLFK
jgi:hypothetical protein